MKRIPILFVFVAAMSLFSCSKGDDSTPKLELKETNYNLIVNEEVQLELVNTDIDISDCDIKSEDDFVVQSYGRRVSALHVGTTQLTINYKGASTSCTVNVESVNNYVIDPYLNFEQATNINDISSYHKEEPISMDTSNIDSDVSLIKYQPGNGIYYITYAYSRTLKRILAGTEEIGTYTNKMIEINSSLMDRCKLLSTGGDIWYVRPNKYYVRVTQGRTSYLIKYAASQSDVEKSW